VRGVLAAIPIAPVDSLAAIGDFAKVGQSGLAGFTQAWLVCSLGPILYLAAFPTIHAAPERFRNAALVAVGVAAVTPLVQWFFFIDPYVRADLGLVRGSGLVGFFQDPHVYAAVLVLGGTVVVSEAIAASRSGKRRSSIYLAALGVLVCTVIVATESRGGILSLFIALALLAGSLLLIAPRRRLRGAWPAVAAGGLILASVVALVSQDRELSRTQSALESLGLERVAGSLEMLVALPRITQTETFQSRSVLWRKAAVAGLLHPTWGVGPGALHDWLRPDLARVPEMALGGKSTLQPQGVIAEVAPNYRWRVTPGADSYWFQVDGGSGGEGSALFRRTVVAADVCDNHECVLTTPPVVVLEASTYTWSVKAQGLDIDVPWSYTTVDVMPDVRSWTWDRPPDDSFPPSWVRDNAHNYYLQVFAEFGLPALLLLCGTWAAVFMHMVAGARHAQRSGQRARILAVLVGGLGFLTSCLWSHPLLLAEAQVVLWLVLAWGTAEATAESSAGALPGYLPQ